MYYGTSAWLTGLWRAPSGRVYVSNADGKIHVNGSLAVDHGKGQWQVTDVRDALFGIWGLDDANVFAWGSRIKDHPVYRFDGKSWSEIANPGFKIESMHGLTTDFIYVVGHDGGIARFDGKSWQRFPASRPEQLTSVFVAGPDEMYAVGAAGSVLEGSAHEWGKIAEGPGLPGPLQCVAKFKDELWVGAGRFGLAKRQGKTSQIDLAKPKVLAVSFDVRQEFVVATKDYIVGSQNGTSFTGTGNGWLLKNLADKPLCYFA
jgi:hypothetical protein